VVDPVPWGAGDRPRPPLVDALQEAIIARRQVELHYRRPRGQPAWRRVAPWGLVCKDEVWYLLAGTDVGRRTYRVDRVLDAVVTDERAEPAGPDAARARPDDFELAAAWEEVVDAVEQRRALRTATVHVDPGLVWVLRAQFGRHCEELGETPEGRAELRVAAPTVLDLARHLAGWGPDLEVTGPDEVRAELARLGRSLVERYEPRRSGPAPGR
jgi:predicted DNA-binding transcriptional regulator YafY